MLLDLPHLILSIDISKNGNLLVVGGSDNSV